MMENGYLRVRLTTASSAVPFAGRRVYVRIANDGVSLPFPLDETNSTGSLVTDSSGVTADMPVMTPDRSLSLDMGAGGLPYAVADVFVRVEGYFPVRVLGIPVFSGEISVLPVDLTPLSKGFRGTVGGVIVIHVPPFSLAAGKMPPKVSLDASVVTPQILQRVVIPETVAVHLGRPDEPAENVYVPFADYIKNVASSEIYPTWKDDALRANILAILSITLNRLFTEWYPSQGYDFDITSSTAFDQAFVYGRSIFENISHLVDEMFNRYLIRSGYINPVFASYCDGLRTTCDGLSQWGSERLASDGYGTLDILRYYYGRDIEIAATDEIGGAAASYPGEPLKIGDRNANVTLIRRALYRIADNYPNIPRVNPAFTLYDTPLAEAVRVFQNTFDLTPDGVVGRATWYRISFIYTSVTRLAEPEGVETGALPVEPPTVELSFGSSGRDTARLQYMLNYIGLFYPNILRLTLDGYYGPKTEQAVREFQRLFELPQTGRVSPRDWEVLFYVYYDILETVTPSLGADAYPDKPLENGSRGEYVLLLQQYLNRVAAVYDGLPTLTADGIFGGKTEQAVKAFQTRFDLPPTGVIGTLDWSRLLEIIRFIEKGA